MARITSHIKALEKALSTRLEVTAYKGAFKSLHETYEFGQLDPQSGQLYFTRDQVRALKAEIEHKYGLRDVREINQKLQTPQNRHQISELIGVDKVAGLKPEQDLLLVKTWRGDLQPLGLEIKLPHGCALQIAYQRIAPLTEVIIVENLDSFTDIHRYGLPEALKDCPIIYRGHNQSTAKGVKQLLERDRQSARTKRLKVIYFGDLDPAGLLISQSFDADALLIAAPNDWHKLKNDPDSAQRQYNQYRNSAGKLSPSLQALYQRLEHQQLAIMQQQYLVQQIPLICHAIDRNPS